MRDSNALSELTTCWGMGTTDRFTTSYPMAPDQIPELTQPILYSCYYIKLVNFPFSESIKTQQSQSTTILFGIQVTNHSYNDRHTNLLHL